MIAGFFKRLTDGATDTLAQEDERLALTALLVRIARADGVYAQDEADQIDRLAIQRYGLPAFEATALRREAETVEADAPDTVRFTRAIKDAVPLEARMAVIEACGKWCWQMVCAMTPRMQWCAWQPIYWGSTTATAPWHASGL